MPDIRADGVAVYVYRRSLSGAIEFLQVRRSASTGEYQHTWQTVYGGVHKEEDGRWKETAVQAARRELLEETGLTPVHLWQVEYVETFYFMPHDYVLMMPVFAAEVAADAELVLNHEHDGHRWVNEAVVDGAFMWRTQREALKYVLEALRGNPEAMRFLTARA